MGTVRKCLKLSDHFSEHEEIFLKAAKQLIWGLYATKDDFLQNEGWKKSIQDHWYYVHAMQNDGKYKTFYIDVRKEIIHIGTSGAHGLVTDRTKLLFHLNKGEKLEMSTIIMPQMRPIPINTKGIPWWKSLFVWMTCTREWEITEDWFFYIKYLDLWIMIPKGFIFDGASVPKLFRNIFSPTGILFLAGLLHDYGYRFGLLVGLSPSEARVGLYPRKVLVDFDRKDWDNLLKEVATQINGMKYLMKGPYWVLLLGGGIAWKKHRKNNLQEELVQWEDEISV